MSWQIAERRIGRAGPKERRESRQREWDVRYGESNGEVGYLLDGLCVRQDDAIEILYKRSYEEHFVSILTILRS